MLSVDLDEVAGIALLEPQGDLSESDFHQASEIVDPYIKRADRLRGIIIHTESFPGWDSFSSLVAHLSFVKDHHKNVSHIALATDSPVGTFAESLATHFTSADVKKFKFSELSEARKWILDSETK
ncbi:MAG: STAS/SEC14 domain-containing protein [Pseudomonadota bacterium]